MCGPAASCLFKRTAPMEQTSIPIAMLWRRWSFFKDGEYLPLPSLDASAVMQLFRRLLLLRLHQAERLSESFMQNLLTWRIRDFLSLRDRQCKPRKLHRCNHRAVLAMDALEKQADGRLAMETPPDPKTGATSMEMDPLAWIHRITSHIPDPGRHCQRLYGAYSNRGRVRLDPADGEGAGLPAAILPECDNSDCSREARSTWARLIKKSSNGPLLCACGGRMRIVSFITDPASSTASFGIGKADAAKPRIHSIRDRLRPQSRTIRNNSDTEPHVRMLHPTPVWPTCI